MGLYKDLAIKLTQAETENDVNIIIEQHDIYLIATGPNQVWIWDIT